MEWINWEKNVGDQWRKLLISYYRYLKVFELSLLYRSTFDTHFSLIILWSFGISDRFFFKDDDTRNIIDRLAEFVAKNGSEFEERTRKKQYGNPRFAFLFGGEFSDYYRFRVMQEVQQCKFVLQLILNFFKLFYSLLTLMSSRRDLHYLIKKFDSWDFFF